MAPVARSLLVTGFGAFSATADNPSAHLARGSGCPHQILEVSFAGVEAFLAGDPLARHDGVILMGYAAGATRLRLETRAVNRIDARADVRGVTREGPIDRSGPDEASHTLWPGDLLTPTCDTEPSSSAGTYLCNYIFYRTLQQYPGKSVGFLHVPAFGMISQERQAQLLRLIVNRLSRGAAVA